MKNGDGSPVDKDEFVATMVSLAQQNRPRYRTLRKIGWEEARPDLVSEKPN